MPKLTPSPGNQLLLFATVTPCGPGEWKITAQKPVEVLTVAKAAKLLDVPVWTVYRLIADGRHCLRSYRPSRGTIKIYRDSVEEYRAATADPEYWTRLGTAPSPRPPRPDPAE